MARASQIQWGSSYGLNERTPANHADGEECVMTWWLLPTLLLSRESNWNWNSASWLSHVTFAHLCTISFGYATRTEVTPASGNIDNTTLINVVPVVVIFVLQSPYKLRPHCCHWQQHCVALSLHSVLWHYISLLWYCAIVSQRSELWGVGASTNNFCIM